jgi:autotransporter-associated beta strand protein
LWPYTPNFVTDTAISTTTGSPLSIGSNSVPLGLAGTISGNGGIAITSGGSATLSGTNSYTGATTISGGFTAVVGPGSISTSSGVSVSSSGVFDISGVGSGTPASASITSLSGTNSTGIVYLGTNQLVLTNASGAYAGTIADGGLYGGAGGSLALTGGTETLSGANTYTGGTALASGTIVVDTSSTGSPGNITSGPLGTGTLAMAAGTTLSFNNGNQTIANAISVTGDPTYVTPTGTTQTISGVISDATPGAPAGAVVADGGGTLVLSGANTYSGGTTICGTARDTICLSANATPTTVTTLQVGASSVGGPAPSAITSGPIGTGTLTLDGGTLQSEISHTLTIANAVQIDSTGGTIDGNGTNLTLSGNITNGNATTGSLTIENTINGAPVLFSGAKPIPVRPASFQGALAPSRRPPCRRTRLSR